MPIISNFPSGGSHSGRIDNPHKVTKAQVGLSNVDNTADKDKPVSSVQATAIADAKNAGTTALNFARNHAQNKVNPHAVTAAQVGAATSAALNAHTGNRSNPHGVTAAQAGAAPAGFGLGADSVSVDSWDDATKNGYYKSSKGTPDGDGNYWHGIVVNYSGVLCNQLVWKTWGIGSMMATRRVNNGVPEKWEWLDPPSIVGVEYLTTERYWGEKVYTKLIDCGVIPVNSSKTVSYGTTLSRVIRCTATTENGSVFPRFTGAGNSPQMTVNPYTRDMQIITTNINMSIAEKVLAQIWYVK